MKKFLLVLLFTGVWQALAGAQDAGGHKASIRVESAELCPGQETDLAVYVDLTGGSESDPLDNFMFYLYISDTSRFEVVTHTWQQQGPGYYMGQPVITDVEPAIAYRGSLVYNYVIGQPSLLHGKGPVGVFTCIWVDGSGGANAFIPDNSRPLFKIRVRCKEQGPVTLDFDPKTLAFSTGLEIFGGYYYDFDRVVNGVITNRQGPDKSAISAGPDSTICIRERVTFNAEGGMSYKWSQVYNPALAGSGGYQDEYLTNAGTKNPTFFPLKQGAYIYQVQVADQYGCYTSDTVVYYVHQNVIHNEFLPAEILTEQGTPVEFHITGSTASDIAPMRVRLYPDSLFPEGGNVLEGSGRTVSGTLQTLPVSEPVLVTAVFEDKVCRAESPARINVRGTKVKGQIAPFPVYRCGNDLEDKRIQLNLLTTGGSGKFLYNWKVTDLEFGEAGDPWISNPGLRNPVLWYIGRCAVSVEVFDMESGETVIISDTMIYRDWLYADVDLVLDTVASGLTAATAGGPFCENTRLTYRARSRYAGSDPSYVWQINGIQTGTGEKDSVFTTTMHKGDSIGVVLYSSEACVAEMAVQSNRLSPDIHYPSILTLSASNTSPQGGAFADCGDSIRLSVLYRSAGRNFRLQWWRNDRDLVYDGRVRQADPDSGSYEVTLPRDGYFDGYSCVISESDMPCIPFDSVSSECIYLNGANSVPGFTDMPAGFVYYPRAAVQAGPISMQGTAAVCEGSEFTLTADVENLPRDFVLKWFRKAGTDSVLLGYYAYKGEDIEEPQEPLDDVERQYDLTNGVFGYGYGSLESGMRDAVRDGFRIVLNDAGSEVESRWKIAAGDTVYYVVYSTSEICGRAPHSSRSPYYVPEQLPTVTDPLVLTCATEGPVCAGSAAMLTASCGNIEEHLAYTWTVNGYSVTDTTNGINRLFTVGGKLGDTLYLHHVFQTTEVACRMEGNFGCSSGSSQTKTFSFRDRVLPAAPFAVRHNADTIVCEGAVIRNWAEVEEYDLAGVSAGIFGGAWTGGGRNSVSAEGSAMGVSDGKRAVLSAKTEAKRARELRKREKQLADTYTISWSMRLDSLLYGAGGDVYEDAVFEHTPKSNGNAPAGTGDLSDTKGITVYYVKVRNRENNCEVYDSVRVLMAHAYEVKAAIGYLFPSPWCDSASGENTDPAFEIEGQPYVRGAQYAALKIENGGDSPRWTYGLNGVFMDGFSDRDTLLMTGASDGDTLYARVHSSMLTCLSSEVMSEPLPIRTSATGTLYAHAPQWAAVGEELLLQAFVGRTGAPSPNLGQFYLPGNYDYSWSRSGADGTWTELGQGSASGKKQMDTMRTEMPSGEAVFRVRAEDRYGVCPVTETEVRVTTAVSTGVDIKAFDPVSGREVSGFCAQTNDFVFLDENGNPGVAARTGGTVSWIGAQGRDSLAVVLRSYPENACGAAYAGFYKNGELLGAGPVGDSAAAGFGLGGVDLRRGDSMTVMLRPGDWVGAFYAHDTVSEDGLRMHYSRRIDFVEERPDGELEVQAQATAICPGETTLLSAAFWGGGTGSGRVEWMPAAAITGGTESWTITASPIESTLYTAVAYDRYSCAWRDTVRVYTIGNDERLPLGIAADSLRFCGEAATVRVYMDESVSSPVDFLQIYWYLIDASDKRVLVDSGLGPLLLSVEDGDRIVAEGKTARACQQTFSVSDTLRFEGVALPVMVRLWPVAADTTVCPGSVVKVAFRAEPADVLWEWYSYEDREELLPGSVSEREFMVRMNRRVRVNARRQEMPSCMVSDTVYLMLFSSAGEVPEVTVAADAVAVCGPKEVTYLARAENCDTLVWYANGREVLRDAHTLVRIPERTGMEGPADSVYAVGIRAAGVCNPAARTVSEPVLVYRVDKPVLRLLCGDTSVTEGSRIWLRADAQAYDGEKPVVAWFDSRSVLLAQQAETEVEVWESDFFRVSARQTALGTGLPDCVSHDTVRVEVVSRQEPPYPPVQDTVFGGIYVPNTILTGSAELSDRELRVYGPGVEEVTMKVYDRQGILLFDRMGEDVAWKATDMQGKPVEAGSYSYWVSVRLKDGRVVEKKGWVSVLR